VGVVWFTTPFFKVSMKLERTTAPATDFITVAEAAFNVKADETYDATKLTRDIKSAIRHAENWCERAFINQTWTMTLRKFPTVNRYNPMGAIFLPKGKIQSVTSLVYYDADGAEQTLVEDTDFTLSNTGEPGMIVPTEALGSWPSTSAYFVDAVTVVYVAGLGTSLPTDYDNIKDACLLEVGDLFQIRQESHQGKMYESGVWKRLLHDSKIYLDFSINDL
jgi:uncharacterized phiE125 gp8 family phage protein